MNFLSLSITNESNLIMGFVKEKGDVVTERGETLAPPIHYPAAEIIPRATSSASKVDPVNDLEKSNSNKPSSSIFLMGRSLLAKLVDKVASSSAKRIRRTERDNSSTNNIQMSSDSLFQKTRSSLMINDDGEKGRASIFGSNLMAQLHVVPTGFNFLKNLKRVEKNEQGFFLTRENLSLTALVGDEKIDENANEDGESNNNRPYCYDTVLQFSKQRIILTDSSMVVNTEFGRKLAMNKLFLTVWAFILMISDQLAYLAVLTRMPPSHLQNTRCHKVYTKNLVLQVLVGSGMAFLFFVVLHRTHKGLAWLVGKHGGVGPYMIFVNMLRTKAVHIYVTFSCFGVDTESVLFAITWLLTDMCLAAMFSWVDAIYISMRVKRFCITLLGGLFFCGAIMSQIQSETLATESVWNDELSIWIMRAKALQQLAGAQGLIAIYLGQI